MKNQDKIVSIIKNLPLFKNTEEDKLPEILDFFSAHTKVYKKGSIVKPLWEPVREAGVVLDGSVTIKFLFDSGNEHRISKVKKGQVFALSFACSKSSDGDFIEVNAYEDTEILFLELTNLFSKRDEFFPEIEHVSINLLASLAEKNVFLNKKIEILSHHKIRDRVMLFLKGISKGKDNFVLPLNREEMASFLGVERSALSRELSKMKKEGLIDFNSNKFHINF